MPKMRFPWRCCCLVFLVISAIVVDVGRAQKRCPPQEIILPCRCLMKGEEFQIWCSHSDLPSVLEGLRAVGQFITDPIDELILENNFLPSLPGRTFIPLKVMRLMLRYNGLERLSSDWLVGLEKSLMELFIVEPDLRSLPDDSLIHLSHLEAITVQTNLMKRYPVFSGLPKLRYIQLESLSLLELSPRNFRDLVKLQTIHISNSPRLTRLEGGLFEDLPRLRLVNISYCGVSWMHPRAISRLPVLKELSLIGNKIVDVGMVGRGSRDMPQLEVLRLDHNYIDKISEAAFVDLPSLKKLYLSNNNVNELEYGAFHRVPLLRTLDLNKNSVRRVHPESFLQHSGSGLEELWLVDNDISHVAELRSLLDALPRLTFLDMSYNNLEAIPFGALRGHPTLEQLHLDYNKIHLIDREAFMAMPALRELRLKNNSLSEILGGPLWNLPALKGLDLSGNYYRRLEPRLLVNLPSLRRIDLSENELTFVDPEAFSMTPALEHINLSRNALSALHPATFRPLLNLYDLDVSYNYLMEFVPNLPRGLEYLHMAHNRIAEVPAAPSPDLDLPSLRMLDISGNEIRRLPSDSLRSLPQLRRLFVGRNLLQKLDEGSLAGLSRLEILDMQHNKLNQIHPSSLREMNELRELNLRNNRLDLLFPEIFKNMLKLKTLDVSRNQIAEILPGTLGQTRELQAIDASNNFLVQLPPNLIGMKNLKKLDLTNNRLKHLHEVTSLTALIELKLSKNFVQELKKGAFDNLQHLKVLHLDHNEIEIVEANAISALPMLKSLKVNNNKLREIPNFAFNNLPGLQLAELQENQIRNIGQNAFHQVPHLVMLNLSRNHLESLDEAGLKSLKSLEMLDVSENRLSRVVSSNLEKMEWLVELRMDDNSICAVHGSPFDGMPRLRVLSMRNNKMMSLPEQAVQKLRGNIAVLDIDGNPLACTCSLLWLQAWLQEGASIGPRCSDGSLLREMRLTRDDCSPEERNLELVAPGCEAELLSAPGPFSTSQVWSNLKSNYSKSSNLDKNHLHQAPTPEESEYFYDEYVDYPYNETEKQLHDTSTMKIEPVTKSPHVTPGDTPTIYAASLNNKTKDIPKEVTNSPSTSGFTFFGVPLPSLNNLWGAGGNANGNVRMDDKKGASSTQIADRKVAIMNKPPRTGGRGGLNLPNTPEIQMGGFVPLLPGTGGFKPIPNPMLQPMTSEEPTTVPTEPPRRHQEIQELSSSHAFSPSHQAISTAISSTIPSTMASIPQSLPSISQSSPSFSQSSSSISQSSSSISQSSPSISQSLQKTSIQVEPETEAPLPPTIPVKIEELPTSPRPEIETKSTDSFKELFSEIVDNVTLGPEALEPTLAPSTTEEILGSASKKVAATPLTTLLAPGGTVAQEFPAKRVQPVVGRITKVPSPHASLLAPVAQVSDPLPHREGKTKQFGVETTSSNGDTSWYFANYNKTNLDPYVGTGEENVAAGGSDAVVKLSWLVLSISLVCMIC